MSTLIKRFKTSLKPIIGKILFSNEWIYPFMSIVGIRINKYSYKGLYDYCSSKGLVRYFIKDENTHYVRSPFCTREGLNAFGEYELGRDYKIYISTISNASVFADSEFIYKDNQILTDRFCYDEFNKYLNPPLLHAEGDKALYVCKGSKVCLDKGIFLLKYWGTGWWHLTCEVIPRILMIDRYEEYREYPLLLDEELFHDQRNVDLINTVNKYNHPIIKIKRKKEYYVQELIYPSHISWLIWDHKQAEEGQSWAIEQSLLSEVRETVLCSLKLEKIFKDKIFISRGNNKRLDNEIEVSKYFEKHGFQVVNPETLTFVEEVEMCYFAKAIVCTTGSAITNILYANKDVRHVLIGAKHCQTEANAPIVDTVGINNYRHYCAQTICEGEYIAQSKIHVTKKGMDEIIEFCNS